MALAAAALHAQSGGGQIEWATSWDQAIQEAKARNVPIMLTVHKDG